MLSTDHSHLRKYLATLGVAIVAGVLSFSVLMLGVQEELLVKESELRTLTASARSTLTRRQEYLEIATIALPWFVLLGFIVGGGVAVYGLVGWARRQVITDEIENITKEQKRVELRRLTDAENVQRLRLDVESAAADEAKTIVGRSEPPAAPTVTRNDYFKGALEAELAVTDAVDRALGPEYQILRGVEATQGNVRMTLDIVAKSRDGNVTYVFEVKYLNNFAKNFKTALAHGISQAALGAGLIGADAQSVVVIAYGQPVTEAQLRRAREYSDRIAASFSTKPKVLLVQADQIDSLKRDDLRSVLLS